MFNIQHFALLGGLIGFSIFIIGLESKGMGNVIIRNGKFSFGGIIKYIKSPFHQNFLWIHPKLWIHNWIIMTGLGIACGTGLNLFLNQYSIC